MPIVQPAEIWQESGRWDVYGAEMFRLQDRHNRCFCLGPTHEEMVTNFESAVMFVLIASCRLVFIKSKINIAMNAARVSV